jgi:hypothetical protein
MKLEFKCPKCGASPHKHGKGGKDECTYRGSSSLCDGLICDCDPDQCPASELADHGQSFNNPCEEAHCYHCGWGGTIPTAPKGLQAWEKKALVAGWTPPSDRAEELKNQR